MASKIKKDFLYNLAYQVLVILLPLVTTPYVSRVLGSEGVGIFGFTYSIVSYFTMFGTLGVGLYGQREIAYKQNDKKSRSEIFWQIFILKFTTMCIAAFVYYLTCMKNSQYSIFYTVFFMELVSAALDISWYYQGLERFKTVALRNMIVKLTFVGLIFLLVKKPEDLWLYIALFAGSNLISNISLWVMLPKTIEKVKIKASSFKKHLWPVFLLLLPQISSLLYTLLDKTMLGLLTSDMNEVGIYEQSQKLERMSLSIITAMTPIMAMRISNLFSSNKKDAIKEKLKKSFHFTWFLATPIAFGIAATAANMVPWFLGEQFMKSIPVMQIGCILVFAVSLSSTSGLQYLVPAKKQNILTISMVTAAIFNFLGNLIMIPAFQAIGAIITSVIAECIVTGIQFHYTKKAVPIKEIFRPTIKCIPCGLLMLAGVAFAGMFLPKTVIGTFVQIVIGAIIYVTAMTIVRDKMMLEIWETVRGTLWKVTHKNKA